MPRILILMLTLLAPLAVQAAAPVLALVHVSVIDVTSATTRPDMTVLIRGAQIVALGNFSATRIPDDAQRIDGSGKFLIPGLWDMHVHVLRPGRPEAYFPLYIANGITGVRDMGGELPLSRITQLKQEIAAGARLGPRLIAAGPLLDGPYPTLPRFTRVVRNGDEARAATRDLQQQGADFIKVYNRLPRDAYFAIAAQAKALGIPFAGHVPFSISAREASDAGQKSIEHLFNVLFACSSQEEELMQLKARSLASDDSTERSTLRHNYLRAVLDSYSEPKARALFALFARNGTWQTPTLVQRRAYALPDEILTTDPRLQYIPKSMRWRFDSKQDPRIQGRDADGREIERRYYEMDTALIAPMHRAGVRFLAGTDSPDPYALPGFSLHDELAQLVAAGLTPLEALQAATRNAAEFLGLRESLGTIAPGKLADLVLLDADPLADIRNTRAIAAVIVNGNYFPRTALDQLLAGTAAAATKN